MRGSLGLSHLQIPENRNKKIMDRKKSTRGGEETEREGERESFQSYDLCPGKCLYDVVIC